VVVGEGAEGEWCGATGFAVGLGVAAGGDMALVLVAGAVVDGGVGGAVGVAGFDRDGAVGVDDRGGGAGEGVVALCGYPSGREVDLGGAQVQGGGGLAGAGVGVAPDELGAGGVVEVGGGVAREWVADSGEVAFVIPGEGLAGGSGAAGG